jgi:hypothetical protein
MEPTQAQVSAVEHWFRSAFPGYEVSSHDLPKRMVVLFRAHESKARAPRHELEVSYEAFDDNSIETILNDLTSATSLGPSLTRNRGTAMAKAKRERWSYRTGEKGVNRVRAYEKDGSILLEFYERIRGSTDPVRKRVSLHHEDRSQAKEKADELAAALRRRDTPQASTLTLHALFYNWYLKEVTPTKSAGKQRHDETAAEMFCRCFGAKRQPQTLSVRDWHKFIAERRSGALRPLSLDAGDEKRPIRSVSDLQLRYDLKFRWPCSISRRSRGMTARRRSWGITL